MEAAVVTVVMTVERTGKRETQECLGRGGRRERYLCSQAGRGCG